jgi:hypothetical protein
VSLAEARGDPAERGRRAGRDDDAAAGAVAHDGAHERARPEVDVGVRRDDGGRRLRRGQRLARQHGLVAFEALVSEQPQVGRHEGADPQLDDVARHERDDVDAGGHAVAHDDRVVHDVGMQGRDRPLRAVLVHEAQPDAQDDDRRDDRGVRRVAGQAGDRRGREEQREQRVPELAHEHPERRHPVHPQGVRAVLREARGCLGRGQPGRARAEGAEHLGGGHPRGGCEVRCGHPASR